MEDINNMSQFTSPSATRATSTECLSPPESSNVVNVQHSAFSPSAQPFQSRMQRSASIVTQPEPSIADTAPSMGDVNEWMMNSRMMPESDIFGDMGSNHNNDNLFNSEGNRSGTASLAHLWSGNSSEATKSEDLISSFDFLVKSLSAANNFLSMLTRDQLFVLRSISPSLLYQLLQEVANARDDRRHRRALPNECAFCKNNGENEECYTSHSLKDWRGRVLCPVLRAFRCPRCRATGDRAHTIKYCPEAADAGMEHSGNLSRRRGQVVSPVMSGTGSRASYSVPTATPATSPLPSTTDRSSFNFLSHFGFQ
ncbi:uncharacterized protein LOC126966259 isoform X2 [Leptidea sinapis]|uniref:Nanos-type domain-containing protein n=2 Tax=Leptidea sinapis TaxID=189913 RepID=A0A5E4Q388_9NEOP|nr:uncharacterized protein LOC126966259 isoform X2 [Leptidea sinapis]VVC92158.1 unnamed protein product [Leptidea sinapis]